jgi:competence protein ComEC
MQIISSIWEWSHDKIWNDIAAQLACKIYAVPVLIGLGIAFYFAWPVEPNLKPAISIIVLSVILSRAAYIRADRIWGGVALSLCLAALACITLGFVAAGARARMIQTPIITAPIGPIGFSGHVQSLEQLEGGKGVRVILTDLHMRDTMKPDQVPHALRLSIRKGGTDIKIGDRIRVFAKIEPPSPPTTPGGFDFRRHAYFNQIGGYGYVLGAPKIYQKRVLPLKGGGVTRERDGGGDTVLTNKITPSSRLEAGTSPFQGEVKPHLLSSLPSLSTWFEDTRNAISAHVNATLPPQQAGMVTALLTGERAAITEENWNALRDSGLAHLLAISGANVDMVALIVFFIARLAMAAFPHFAERHPIKKYAAVIAFLAALFYVLLILPSTPTLRALLTVAIVLLAVILDRSPISLRLVCTSATIILLWQPEQLLSPSFQLSFAAVTALVAVFEVLAPWLKRIYQDSTAVRRLVIYILGVCGTTVIATLATAPISLYHFQNLALYGVIANLLAVPIMTFLIMPLSILCYVLMPLGAADSTLHVVGSLNDVILTIAHRTASLPGARFSPAAIPFTAFIAVVSAGLILCLTVGRLRAIAILPLIIAGIIITTHSRPDMVILAGGKVIMERRADGIIITNTKKFARRTQTDWVRYWGGDGDKGAVVDRINPPTLPAGVMMTDQSTAHSSGGTIMVPTTDRPVAIYLSNPPRVQIMTTYGTGRYWE